MNLEYLEIFDKPLTSLKLPKDLALPINAWAFVLKPPKSLNLQLSVHYKMKNRIGIDWVLVNRFDDVGTWIPPVWNLIGRYRNAGPFEVKTTFSDGESYELTVDVYGFTMMMFRMEDGVKIDWEEGTLQSAPTINGLWEDVASGGGTVRRLFQSSLPSEFFRVKPLNP